MFHLQVHSQSNQINFHMKGFEQRLVLAGVNSEIALMFTCCFIINNVCLVLWWAGQA